MENEDKRKQWREAKKVYLSNKKYYTLIFHKDTATRLENAAKEKNMTVREFIKALITSHNNGSGYVVPKDDILKNLIIEIRRIGTNINQITRFIHKDKSIRTEDIQYIENRLSQLEVTIIEALTNPPEK